MIRGQSVFNRKSRQTTGRVCVRAKDSVSGQQPRQSRKIRFPKWKSLEAGIRSKPRQIPTILSLSLTLSLSLSFHLSLSLSLSHFTRIFIKNWHTNNQSKTNISWVLKLLEKYIESRKKSTTYILLGKPKDGKNSTTFCIIIIIIIIMSCHRHGYPWPSLNTSPYRSSPPTGLQGYIPYPRIAALCWVELVVPLLLGHM